MNKVPVNCHVHIFNSAVIPESILGGGVFNFLLNMVKNAESPWGINILSNIVGVFWGKERARRIKAIANAVVHSDSQKGVLIEIVKAYQSLGYENMKFVVLCQDMDHTGLKSNNYVNAYTQMMDVVSIMKDPDYNDKIIPFVAIDPRSTRPPIEIVRQFVESYNFKGIKLYPTVGFFGDDERLMPVYEYAVKNNLPIMVHYNIGVIHYKGKLPYRTDKSVFNYKKHKNYQANFLNPDYFRNVLLKFPKLKICFAHFGASMEDDTLENILTYNHHHPYTYFSKWNLLKKPPHIEEVRAYVHRYIVELIKDPAFPNVYADVAFDFARPVFKRLISNYMKEETLNKHILFGTDYFVNLSNKNYKDEVELVDDFIRFFNNNSMIQDMMVTNNDKYLNSKTS